MSKEEIDKIVSDLKSYVEDLLSGYSQESLEGASFERDYMKNYQGGEFITQDLFRRYLRQRSQQSQQGSSVGVHIDDTEELLVVKYNNGDHAIEVDDVMKLNLRSLPIILDDYSVRLRDILGVYYVDPSNDDMAMPDNFVNIMSGTMVGEDGSVENTSGVIVGSVQNDMGLYALTIQEILSAEGLGGIVALGPFMSSNSIYSNGDCYQSTYITDNKGEPFIMYTGATEAGVDSEQLWVVLPDYTLIQDTTGNVLEIGADYNEYRYTFGEQYLEDLNAQLSALSSDDDSGSAIINSQGERVYYSEHYVDSTESTFIYVYGGLGQGYHTEYDYGNTKVSTQDLYLGTLQSRGTWVGIEGGKDVIGFTFGALPDISYNNEYYPVNGYYGRENDVDTWGGIIELRTEVPHVNAGDTLGYYPLADLSSEILAANTVKINGAHPDATPLFESTYGLAYDGVGTVDWYEDVSLLGGMFSIDKSHSGTEILKSFVFDGLVDFQGVSYTDRGFSVADLHSGNCLMNNSTILGEMAINDERYVLNGIMSSSGAKIVGFGLSDDLDVYELFSSRGVFVVAIPGQGDSLMINGNKFKYLEGESVDESLSYFSYNIPYNVPYQSADDLSTLYPFNISYGGLPGLMSRATNEPVESSNPDAFPADHIEGIMGFTPATILPCVMLGMDWEYNIVDYGEAIDYSSSKFHIGIKNFPDNKVIMGCEYELMGASPKRTYLQGGRFNLIDSLYNNEGLSLECGGLTFLSTGESESPDDLLEFGSKPLYVKNLHLRSVNSNYEDIGDLLVEDEQSIHIGDGVREVEVHGPSDTIKINGTVYHCVPESKWSKLSTLLENYESIMALINQ
ncbi:MAG: hypothetical protein J6V13_03845 [Paludibacteraceae bacterium]|nr:hypothetical protein [Paludibacteraceae bacterium]